MSVDELGHLVLDIIAYIPINRSILGLSDVVIPLAMSAQIQDLVFGTFNAVFVQMLYKVLESFPLCLVLVRAQ